MMKSLRAPVLLVTLAVAAVPVVAWAQADASLSSLNGGELRAAVQQRYDAALAATLDAAIVNANDPRYLWASEAKAQCGIALGYLQSGTKDEVSINKCGLAAERMTQIPAPIAAPPPPQTRTCPDGTVRPVSQQCPVPPPPVVAPVGERG